MWQNGAKKPKNKVNFSMFVATRDVRGSDYSQATVPSEEKDTSVLKNFDV